MRTSVSPKAAELLSQPREFGQDASLFAERGIVTKTGHLVTSFGIYPADPSKGGDGTLENDFVRTVGAWCKNGKYVKLRFSKPERAIRGGEKQAIIECLGIQEAPVGTPPTDLERDADGKIQIPLEEKRISFDHIPYLRQFRTLCEELGITAYRPPHKVVGSASTPQVFGFKRVWDYFRGFQGNETLPESESGVSPGELRKVLTLRTGRAFESTPTWKPVNITRSNPGKKSAVDTGGMGDAYTFSDFLRFLTPPEDYPETAYRQFKDRFGVPLFDPITKLWREIKSHHNDQKVYDEIREKTEWVSNGLESHIGNGWVIMPIICEQPSNNAENLRLLVENPAAAGITIEELWYNIHIQIPNLLTKFPDLNPGEVKFVAPTEIKLTDDHSAAVVAFLVFNTKNTGPKENYGAARPNKLGIQPERENYSRAYGWPESQMPYCPEKKRPFKEDPVNISIRDRRDRDQSRVNETPLNHGDQGIGYLWMYSILDWINGKHFLLNAPGQWLVRLTNIDILCNQEADTPQEAKYLWNKFDMSMIAFPVPIYGWEATTYGSDHRCRLIMGHRYTYLPVKNGLERPFSKFSIPGQELTGDMHESRGTILYFADHRFQVKSPEDLGPYGNNPIMFLQKKLTDSRYFYGDRLEFQYLPSGDWQVNYYSTVDQHIRRRREEAYLGVEGVLVESKSIGNDGKPLSYYVQMPPWTFDTDRALLHKYECPLRGTRWATEFNQVVRAGGALTDTGGSWEWNMILLNNDARFNDIHTVGFTSRQWIISQLQSAGIDSEEIQQILVPITDPREKAEQLLDIPGAVDALIGALTRIEQAQPVSRDNVGLKLLVRIHEMLELEGSLVDEATGDISKQLTFELLKELIAITIDKERFQEKLVGRLIQLHMSLGFEIAPELPKVSDTRVFGQALANLRSQNLPVHPSQVSAIEWKLASAKELTDVEQRLLDHVSASCASAVGLDAKKFPEKQRDEFGLALLKALFS